MLSTRPAQPPPPRPKFQLNHSFVHTARVTSSSCKLYQTNQYLRGPDAWKLELYGVRPPVSWPNNSNSVLFIDLLLLPVATRRPNGHQCSLLKASARPIKLIAILPLLSLKFRRMGYQKAPLFHGYLGANITTCILSCLLPVYLLIFQPQITSQ